MLPGVGPRTAERFALHLLRQPSSASQRLAEALAKLHDGVAYCQKTGFFVEPGESISHLYSDSDRDKQQVAVVRDALDVVALEKTGHFHGTYHVLGGLISPIDGVDPSQLRIKELLERIKEDKVTELILAIDGSVEGETTALYIRRQLGEDGPKITRLARGLPAGIELEYADQTTLARALEGRQHYQ